jgi:hypothetical protein
VKPQELMLLQCGGHTEEVRERSGGYQQVITTPRSPSDLASGSCDGGLFSLAEAVFDGGDADPSSGGGDTMLVRAVPAKHHVAVWECQRWSTMNQSFQKGGHLLSSDCKRWVLDTTVGAGREL